MNKISQIMINYSKNYLLKINKYKNLSLLLTKFSKKQKKFKSKMTNQLKNWNQK